MKKLNSILIIGLIFSLLVGSTTSFASKSKAAKFYNQAETYANEGRWDFAADNYASAVKEHEKYKDAKEKLANAKVQACSMLMRMGDEAKAKEKFDEAVALYQRALTYQPTSAEAKAKIDNLSQEMVSVYYTRGKNYESQRLWKEAIKEYEKAYAIKPDYQDLKDHYQMVKARLAGNMPIGAVLFFVNSSSHSGLDTAIIQALNTELSAKYSQDITLVDYRKVQNVVAEQAGALGETLNDKLAMDLGRLLGANQVIVGEITAEDKNPNKLKVTAKLMKVPQGEVIEDTKENFKFDDQAEMTKKLPELTKDLAKKLIR